MTTWAWGTGNSTGGLGVGDVATHLTPTPTVAVVDFLQAVGGLTNARGLDAVVYWFGSRFRNSWDGIDESFPFPSNPNPILVRTLSSIVKIGSGNTGVYALDSVGNFFGSGTQQSGEFGIGISDGTTIGVTLLATGVLDFAVGSIHNLILRAGGVVQAAGAQFYGAGDAVARSTWTTVTPPGPATVVGIRAGSLRSYTIMSNGTVRGAGRSTRGELGLDSVATSPPGVENSWVTLPFTNVIDIASANDAFDNDGATFALLGDGTVWTIGSNGNFLALGLLGSGNTTTTHTSTPVQVTVPLGVTPVALARHNSTAANGGFIGSDGLLYLWGYGGAGTMGNGLQEVLNPVPVAQNGLSNVTWADLNFSQIFADGGLSVSSSLARTYVHILS